MRPIRCLNPQCGSEKVADAPITIRPNTGKPAGHSVWARFGRAFLVCIIGGFVSVTLLVAGSANAVPSNLPLVNPTAANPAAWTVGALVAYSTITGAAPLLILVGLVQASRKHVLLYRYRCAVCGAQWEWREDQPHSGTPSVRGPSTTS